MITQWDVFHQYISHDHSKGSCRVQNVVEIQSTFCSLCRPGVLSTKSVRLISDGVRSTNATIVRYSHYDQQQTLS